MFAYRSYAKLLCIDIAQEILTTFNDDPDLLKKVITADEALNLAPANFFLFPKVKILVKGKRFATIEKIKEKSKIDTEKRVSELFWRIHKTLA